MEKELLIIAAFLKGCSYLYINVFNILELINKKKIHVIIVILRTNLLILILHFYIIFGT